MHYDRARISIWQFGDCQQLNIFPRPAKPLICLADLSILWIWTTRLPSSTISLATENSFVSRELSAKLQVGLAEFEIVRRQFDPLLLLSVNANADVIQTSAACAMLHSFYTEIEKLLKLIAREWDGYLPSAESWHRDLLTQMSEATPKRPAVLPGDLISTLKDFLAFRHLFRGASIALMRWEKLYPLVAKVDSTYQQVSREIEIFRTFIESH